MSCSIDAHMRDVFNLDCRMCTAQPRPRRLVGEERTATDVGNPLVNIGAALIVAAAVEPRLAFDFNSFLSEAGSIDWPGPVFLKD